MFKNYVFLANFAIWCANIFFFCSLVPQILLNYKRKSASGLSELMLLGYLNGYACTLYYIFCLNMPIGYKIIVPISTSAFLIILFQRFYYINIWSLKSYKLLFFYLLNFVFIFSMIPIAKLNPIFIGTTAGWIMTTIWAVYQLPQIAKIFFSKSVMGFSFFLVTFIALGNFIELLAAIFLGLPNPTIFNAIRSLVTYSVFCMQFWIYKD